MRVAAVSITGVSVVDPDPDRTAVDLSALILDLQACPWLRGRCEGGRRRWSRLPQAIARVRTGGGSDAINGRSADGGALGAAALDTSSQELLI